jgi:hypothetical protein
MGASVFGTGVLGAIGSASFFIAAIVATVFIVLYPLLAPFYRSEAGWHIFSFMVVVALLLDHGSATLIFGQYPGREWVRGIGFPLLAIVLTWRVLILIRVQLLRRKMLKAGDKVDVQG